MSRRSILLLSIAALLLAAGAAWLCAPAMIAAFPAWWVSSPELADQWPNRGINNAGELWKNGHLGFFFRYELFGTLPFLCVPAWLAFLFTARGRPRWQWSLFWSGTLSAVLIGFKGFYNFRYAFTLQPLIVVFIIFMAWTVSNRKAVRAVLIGAACLLIAHGYRCQYGRYDWFFKSLISAQNDGLPWPIMNALNAAAGKERIAALSMNCNWPRYYTKCEIIDYRHPSVSHLLQAPDDETLKLLFHSHGISYVISSDSNEAWLEKTSLQSFVDLLRSDALRISAGGNSLYCLKPRITSWSDLFGLVDEILFPVMDSPSPVDCELLVGAGGLEHGWINVGWRGKIDALSPKENPEVMRLVAGREGPDIGESCRHILLLQPSMTGEDGISIPAGAKIAEFECKVRSGTPKSAGSLLLRLDANTGASWCYKAAAHEVNSPTEKWETHRAILYLNDEFESLNPILEWQPGAEGDVLEIRSPVLRWIPFPAEAL